jgi:site-specific recombinase XerD
MASGPAGKNSTKVSQKKRLTFRFRQLYLEDGFKVPFDENEVSSAVQPAGTVLRDWISYYLKEEVLGVESPRTYRSKRYDLHKFLAYVSFALPEPDVRHWNKAFTQTFCKALEDERYGQATIYRVFATLSNFAQFLVDCQVIAPRSHPTRKVRLLEKKPPPFEAISVKWADKKRTAKLPDIDNARKYELFMEAAESFVSEISFDPNLPRNRALPLRDRAIIWMLFNTGLRAEELCGIPVKSREAAATKGVWFDGVKRKGNRSEDIYVAANGKMFIDQYDLQERGKIIQYARGKDKAYQEEPYLFLSWRGHRLNQSALWNIVQKIATRASATLPPGLVFKAHPHSLRHERGYRLRDSGHGDAFIAEQLGHRNLSQVYRYSKGSEAQLEKTLEETQS